MHKKVFASLSLVFVLSISLIMGMAISANAQALAPTPVPTATQQLPVQPSNPNVVTFSMLGRNEIQLIGPLAATTFSFSLPADWKLSAGAQLNLAMAVSFNVIGQVQSASSTPVANSLAAAGGTLSVSFNNVLLGVLQLNQLGEVQGTLPIPVNALISSQANGRMDIRFVLDSRYACNVNQQMVVTIHTSSQFLLPHDSVALSTSLANFPQPIYQGSFAPDSALIVIPDQPSSADLQEAMTVAAGLGNLSGNKLELDIATVSQLTSDQKLANHLIFVGKAASLPTLQQLQLPVPFNAGQFQVAGGSQDDGVIEMINSPWSANHIILVVSGDTDQGALKAAQAVTTGNLLSNHFPNVSIVQDIQSAPASPMPVDQTLTEMGYSRSLFANIGVDTVSYQFYIPPGWTIASDAHFDLIFGNSELLNYDRSGIVVAVNNIPIGSVRLSDATAAQATNKVGISIPTSAVLPGYNTLTVNVNLIPIDDCTPPNLQGLWIQIWPELNLHLPLNQAQLLNPVSDLNLATYPAPFIYDPKLANTALVLPHNDLASWREALQIAAYLGQSANGTLSALSVYYGDQIPETDRAKYNLLVIGLPSQSQIISEMNSSLPVPFSSGDNLSTINSSQVVYRISPDSPLGYLEIMPSPWNPNNIVLAALGNTPKGVSWATSALIDPTLRSSLAGNFDVINNRQILTIDTRISSVTSATSVPTLLPGVQALAPGTGVPTASPSRPSWILPLIVVLVVLIILILIFVVVGSRLRDRMHRPHKND